MQEIFPWPSDSVTSELSNISFDNLPKVFQRQGIRELLFEGVYKGE